MLWLTQTYLSPSWPQRPPFCRSTNCRYFLQFWARTPRRSSWRAAATEAPAWWKWCDPTSEDLRYLPNESGYTYHEMRLAGAARQMGSDGIKLRNVSEFWQTWNGPTDGHTLYRCFSPQKVDRFSIGCLPGRVGRSSSSFILMICIHADTAHFGDWYFGGCFVFMMRFSLDRAKYLHLSGSSSLLYRFDQTAIGSYTPEMPQKKKLKEGRIPCRIVACVRPYYVGTWYLGCHEVVQK